jgi:short subunit fatty acids transporter
MMITHIKTNNMIMIMMMMMTTMMMMMMAPQEHRVLHVRKNFLQRPHSLPSRILTDKEPTPMKICLHPLLRYISPGIV